MKQKMFSLQYKFIIIALCITIIPLTIVGGVSYAQSIKIIEKQVSQSNLNTIEQIGENIDWLLETLDSSSMYLWRNNELMENLQVTKEDISQQQIYQLSAQHEINNFIVFHPEIYSIYISGFNGLEFDSCSAYNQISKTMKEKIIELRGGGMIISDQIILYGGTLLPVISFLRVFKDPYNLSKDLAIMKINISETSISQIYGGKLLSPSSDIFIVDQDYKIVSSLDQSKIGVYLGNTYLSGADVLEENGYIFKKINKEEMLVTSVKLSPPGWKLVSMVPMKELAKDSTIIQKITLTAILTSIFLCLLICIFFTYYVLSPLKKLRKSMEGLEEANFNITLTEKGNDEIALVKKSFNKMSRKLNELINQVYVGELKQKEAELKILQEQINPHFLYNTLNTIYWMCKMEMAPESAKLVDGLSKLFRLSLNRGNEITTVKNEIEHLGYYIMIMDKRYEEMLNLKVEVSDETLKCNVIKLVLQPMVENAVYHGIEKKGSAGTILVQVYREEDDLVYVVSDDGAGAIEEQEGDLQKEIQNGKKGFALKNVNDRIKLHFGNAYGIEIQTKWQEGTKVTVRQPFHTM